MPGNGANIGLSIATGRRDLRLDPYLSFNFVVEIEGLLAGAFSSCSGLEVETEKYEYREGGVNGYIHRFAGATHHPPLVLKHGLSPIDGLWNWHQDVVAGLFIRRRNGTIYLLNAGHVPVMWWNFTAALPTKWSGPSLDAATNAVAFETIELVHRGLGRPRLGLPTDADGIAGEAITAVNTIGNFF